jgi:hypothetical protein
MQTKKQDIEMGAITIKVIEEVGPFDKQSGSVSFGISSLDQLAAKYEINSLTNRFKHRPIPINSHLPDLSRLYKIEFPDKYNVISVASDFSKDLNIEYAEPIPKIFLLHEPNDNLYSVQWHLPKIQAPEAWDIHKGEEGDSTIILAITDSGVDWDHPDLVDNIWNNLGEDADGDNHTLEWNGTQWVFDPGDLNSIDDDDNGFIDDLVGWNFDDNNNNPDDNDNHGTVVSGLSNAVTNNQIGVASISYNLNCMPVKGFDYNSVIYAAENGADIINCSWGYYLFTMADLEAVEYATGLGSIIVAAAGNESANIFHYPAAFPNVIAVAGVNNQDLKAVSSSYGIFIDVCAPVGDLWTTIRNGGYTTVGLGTSHAAPQVTGLLGLIKSYHPTWTNDQILTQLVGTAENIDLLNPGYENLLGSGRINAFHSLADTNIVAPQKLKLLSQLLYLGDENTTQSSYPGEIINLSLEIQNFSVGVYANNFSVTLTTNDPDIQILDGEYVGFLPADHIIELIDEFQIQISPSATTHIANLTYQYSAEVPIVLGDEFSFDIIVNPDGVLVWEGVENGQDYSGEFIKNYLTTKNAYLHLYTTNPVLSYNGLDAAFLSFGNFGSNGLNTPFNNFHATIVQDYLESGGRVYLEGGDALGFDQYQDSVLFSLFGISSVDDGGTNFINSLQGQDTTITQGMLFTSSTQTNIAYIDKYFPDSNGVVAFYESSYGNVAVQSIGTYGQRTFCFSYALAELVDGDPPTTRDSLIQRILNFFEVPITSIEDELQLPTKFTLMQNYPNPFNPNTKIKYSIPQSSNVRIKVFDILGNEIETLVNEEKPVGTYELTWYAEGLPSGVYFYQLKAGDFIETKKMVLVK